MTQLRTKILTGTGGLVTKTNAALIPDDASPDAQNVDHNTGTIHKRHGARKVNALAIGKGGLNFDGVSGWVYIPDTSDYDITAALTLEVTYKPTTVAGAAGEQVLIGRTNLSAAAGSRISWTITQVQSGGVERFRFRYTAGGTERTLTDTSTTVAAGTRYHVAATFVDGQQNIFVTNVDTGTTGTTSRTDAGALLNLDVPILLGAAGRSTAGFVDFTDTTAIDDEPVSGVLDEVRIWAATLASGTTPATALSTYRDRELDTSHPNATSLRGYWKLNDRSSVTANDDMSEIRGSGTDNNGFLEPRRPQYQTGLVPDEQLYAIKTDGYDDAVILPFAGFPSTDTDVRASYAAFVQQGNTIAWTIELAVEVPTGGSVASKQLFHWKTDAVSPDGFVLVVSTTAGGLVQAEVTTAGAGGANVALLTATSAAALVAGTTTMISVQRKNIAGAADRTQVQIFLDGVASGSAATSANDGNARDRGPGGNLANAFIGSNGLASTSSYTSCAFDEVRFWARVGVVAGDDTRTAAQILQYFDKPLSQKEIDTQYSGVNGLIGYWKFDDNDRDYNDGPAATTTSGTRPNIFSEDSGRSNSTAGPPLRIVGGLSAALWPGTHIPEWTPGLLRAAVQGGLIDLVTAYKIPSGTQELIIVGEGEIVKAASTSFPAQLTVLDASGFQGGRPASRLTVGDHLYLTNGLGPPVVYDGSIVRRWGIQGPTRQTGFKTSGAGTGINGNVAYRYTYLSRESGVESDPSPLSATYLDSTSANQVTLLLQPSPDTQVDAIRIYRTLHGNTTVGGPPGSSELRFVDEITNTPTATTPSEYTDMVGDASLGFPLDSRDGFATAGPPPWCQYAVLFNDRVWMANDPRDEKTRSQLFYSASGQPEEFGILNVFNVESGEGEPITGLGVLFDRLYIFKRTAIYVLSGFGEADFQIQQLSAGLGCISHFSIIAIDGWLYWLSERGPYRTNGSDFEWIGEAIYPTFQALSKASVDTANAGHNRDRQQVWFAMRTSSTGTNDRVLVYDYGMKVWSLFTNLWPQVLEGIVDDTGTNRIFWGDDYGFVWRGDTSNSFNQGDLGEVGTTFGTLSATGLAGSFVTITVTGAFAATATNDGWKGSRIIVIDSDGTESEGRILTSTSTVLTIDKTLAQLGFTPASGDGYRVGSITAYWKTKPFALVEPGMYARTEETEVEGIFRLDNNTPVSLTQVRIEVSVATEFSTTFSTPETRDVTVGAAGSDVSSSERMNTVARAKRTQFQVANDFCHEGFEIRTMTITAKPDGRT